MVGIFITWILVSVAMFQLGLDDVDTSAQGTAVIANKPASSKAAATDRATPATPAPRTTEAPQAVKTATPSTTTPPASAPVTTPGPTTAPTGRAPTREAPTPATSTTAAPTTPLPGEWSPTTVMPPPASATQAAPTLLAPTLPAPTPEVSTPSASTTVHVAGPRLVLTASVAKKGTLASTLLSGLSPAGTLTEIAITSGRGNLVGMTPNGDYVFEAPNGKDTTVITFTYTQGGIPVTGNVLTISTD